LLAFILAAVSPADKLSVVPISDRVREFYNAPKLLSLVAIRVSQ